MACSMNDQRRKSEDQGHTRDAAGSSADIPRRTAYRWKRRMILNESSVGSTSDHQVSEPGGPSVVKCYPRRTATRRKKKMIMDYMESEKSYSANDCRDSDNDLPNSFNETDIEDNDSLQLNNLESSKASDEDQDSVHESHGSLAGTDDEQIDSLQSNNNKSSDALEYEEDSDMEQNNIIESNDSLESEQYKYDLLLLALKLRHKLSEAAIGDLLKLCNFLTGRQCVSNTAYFFNKQFSSVTSTFVFHYLCTLCGSYVKDDRPNQECQLKCTNRQCSNNDVKKRNKNTFFVYLSVKHQLIDLLENHHIDGSLLHTGNRVKKVLDNYEDILDGTLYKAAMPVGDCSNLSLSFNSDGVPVFSSSQCSVWPILCTVNELPPEKRRDHVILAAIWFGGCKPVMNSFLDPFVQEMRELHDIGFCWTRSEDNAEIRTKVKTLVGVCDSVARPAIQSFTQFNGKYGCSYCFDSGSCVAQGDGHTRVYPYDVNSTPRTSDSVVHLAEQAIMRNEPALGVKGPSVVDLIPGFNIIDGLVPDYMHSVLLGVVRQLAKLWFDSNNSNEEFYVSTVQQRLIDFDLAAIRPPCNISRIPRSLSTRKYWKAHEWYMWLVYYSLPILKSYLSRTFFTHYALLVEGITILLGESISPDSIDHSDIVLKQFVKDFQQLYGLNNMSFNVHLCLHLACSVRSWGPLWAHSAFVYESFNGDLLRMIKGTQAVPIQICKTFALHRALPMFCARVNSDSCSDEYKAVLQSFLSSTSGVSNCIKINGVTCFGRSRLRQLTAAHHVAVHVVANHVNRNTMVSYYDRIITNGEMIHSRRYCRNLLRNSYTVELADHSIFVIVEFMVGDFGHGNNGYAVGYCYQRVPNVHVCSRSSGIVLGLSHFVCVGRDLGRLTVVPVQDIRRKCLLLSSRNNAFDIVCTQINLYEYCA